MCHKTPIRTRTGSALLSPATLTFLMHLCIQTAYGKTVTPFHPDGVQSSEGTRQIGTLKKGDTITYPDGERFEYLGTTRQGGTTYVLKVRSLTHPGRVLALRAPKLSQGGEFYRAQESYDLFAARHGPVPERVMFNESFYAAYEWIDDLRDAESVLHGDPEESRGTSKIKVQRAFIDFVKQLAGMEIGDFSMRQIGFDAEGERFVLFDWSWARPARGGNRTAVRKHPLYQELITMRDEGGRAKTLAEAALAALEQQRLEQMARSCLPR